MKIIPRVHPMRFWSQKVLPLVYDDSLSYYEVLCKVVHKLNEVINYVGDGLEEYIRNVLNQYFADVTYVESTHTIVLKLEEEDE